MSEKKPDCPHCGRKMTIQDTTKTGRIRWRCNPCKKSSTMSEHSKKSPEAIAFERALAEAKGNKKQAAKLLKIPFSQFRLKLESMNIDGFYNVPKKTKTYVIFTVQNATPVFENFLKSLKHYAEFNNAELVAIPVRYKNPTSLWTHKNTDAEWWAPEIMQYLCDSRFNINDNLTVMADIKIQPTAVNPLSDLESISKERSAIFGHTKLALKTVPVVSGSFPKIIATTGAVTVRNYTDTKTGKKGDFHHSFSAQAVEVRGDRFHIRQLNAISDGSFIDLNYEYTPDGVYHADPALGLVLGDWHDHMVNPKVVKGTFTNKNSLVNTINPLEIVWHDALDFYSRNHHHYGQPFINLAKFRDGVDNVRKEVETVFKKIEKLASGRRSVFPYSNHPDALARWIKSADWKSDPINAEFYLETALAMVRSTKMNGHKSETIDPFSYWGKKFVSNPDDFVFLGPRESYDIGGIKVDMHGHLGPNGSRGGNVNTFGKLGVKNITAHGHGPGISNGAYRVGTSSEIDAEYNIGPSNWLNTHCPIYANGKRSLVSMIDGEFR